MSYARTAVTRMTLDMSRPDLQRSETVTQGDTNRRWEVTLINGGAPFRLPPNWTAALTGIKPDGNGLLNGCSVADGKIIYDFAAGKEIATCVGSYPVQFDIWDEVGELVASPKLYVNVLADVRPHAELESNGQYTQIGELIGRVNQTDKDVDLLAETVLAQGTDITALKEKITTAGTVTIPASEWSDITPYTAYMGFPSDTIQKGQVVMFIPMDDATKEAASKARLSVGIDQVSDAGGEFTDFVPFLRADGGTVPTVALNLGYVVLRTGGESDAMVALIGVDAYGEGGGTGGGVGEDAVKNIINNLLGNVANVLQYSADNPPPYPVTDVNGKTGAVKLNASDVGARPSTWMPTAADVGADPENTAQTLVNDLARKTAQEMGNYYTKSQTLTKDEINTLVSAIPKFSIEAVTSLPTSNISDTTVYLVKSGDDDTNLYTEYIRVGDKWEKLGTQTVDLTGYATEAWVNEVLAAYVNTDDLIEAIDDAITQALSFYLTAAKAAELYQPKGSYVQAESGKGLTTNDYTNADKEKVSKALTEHQSLDHLVKINQGSANAGKILMVGPDGLITLGDTPEGGGGIGYVDSNNNIIITAELPDGKYSVKYETSDGLVDIGELQLGAVEEPDEPTARLPEEYQEVEWVQIINAEQVDSNSCIVTGLNWSEVDKIVVKLQHVNTNNTKDISISSFGGVGAVRSAPYIGTRPENNPNLMGWQSGLTNYSVSPSVSATSPDAHELTATFSCTSASEIAVGGWSDATHSHPHRWYKMQFYKGSTLLADYVPCYRKADDVNGFYDLVRGTFNVNAENQNSSNPQLKYFQYRGNNV